MKKNPAFSTAMTGRSISTKTDKPYFSSGKKKEDWDKIIYSCISHPMDNTIQRQNVYEILRDNIPADLTEKEAVDAIEVLRLIANRSHANTLTQLSHFMGVINHCIDQIHKKSQMGWAEILTKYHDKFSDLLDRLGRIDYSERLYTP
jgi:hypothetical protein